MKTVGAHLLAIVGAVVGLVGPAVGGIRAGQVGGIVGGSAPAQTVRDRTPGAVAGTGTLRGRVVDGETGAPLPRVRVRLAGATTALVVTGADGVFTFSKLAAGLYSVFAEKVTYSPAAYPARGQSLRGAANGALIVREGGVVDSVVIAMIRGSAITGRVLDANGDVIENAQVAAFPVTAAGTVKPGPSIVGTNDIGEFRLARLQPGRYLLTVSRFQDSAPVGDGPPLPQPVPTYYPGVLAQQQALPIAVGRGELVAGIDVVMAEAVPTVVNGHVTFAETSPPASGVTAAFVNVRLDGLDPRLAGVGGTSVKPDGSFRMLLPPGDYSFEVQRRLVMSEAAARAAVPPRAQYGRARVSVAGAAVDVSIVVGPGATATGRVLFEGTAPPPVTGEQGIPLTSPDGTICTNARAIVAPDWSFTVEGLYGTCGSAAFARFGRWSIKSVMIDGQERQGQTMTFETGQRYEHVQIVLTDKQSTVRLQVTDERGQPTREYAALIFSTDKSRWAGSRAIIRSFVPLPAVLLALRRDLPTTTSPSAPTDPDAVSGLPPGDYFAIALDDIDQDGSRDPAVLERLAERAVRIAVGEGAIDVPLSRMRLKDIVR